MTAWSGVSRTITNHNRNVDSSHHQGLVCISSYSDSKSGAIVSRDISLGGILVPQNGGSSSKAKFSKEVQPWEDTDFA